MYLLDTQIVSYASKQHPLAALYEDVLTSGAPLFIALQTEAELLFGAKHAGWGAKRLAMLQATLSKYRLSCAAWLLRAVPRLPV